MLADLSKEPTLKEMTRFAIQALNRDPNGFFLFVEGKLTFFLHDAVFENFLILFMMNYVGSELNNMSM